MEEYLKFSEDLVRFFNMSKNCYILHVKVIVLTHKNFTFLSSLIIRMHYSTKFFFNSIEFNSVFTSCERLSVIQFQHFYDSLFVRFPHRSTSEHHRKLRLILQKKGMKDYASFKLDVSLRKRSKNLARTNIYHSIVVHNFQSYSINKIIND